MGLIIFPGNPVRGERFSFDSFASLSATSVVHRGRESGPGVILSPFEGNNGAMFFERKRPDSSVSPKKAPSGERAELDYIF
jgi:hypothetical protein